MATPPITSPDTDAVAPARTRGPLPVGLLVAAATGIALVSGLLGGVIGRWTTDGGAVSACPASSVADDVLPSVVTLLVSSGSSGGNGSGAVVRAGGYILTNDHVISPAGSTGTIDVLFSGGRTAPATVVGRAPQVDLAVVKAELPRGVSTIAIGQSRRLRVGQPVVALGSPLGLSGTVTSGIVSALGRDVPVPADGGQTAVLPGAIQTDAAINPGNSGGALVDCAGRLVGVNTAIATVPTESGEAGGGSVGIGFAIPSDVAMTVADQLIGDGWFSPPYLGVAATPIPPALADRFGVADGLYVQTVSPGGPAQQAGLRPGDVVTAIAGRATTDSDSLLLATLTRRPGDRVPVEFTRAGASERTVLTLGSSPP